MNRLLSAIVFAGGLSIVAGEIGSMLHYTHDSAHARAGDSLTSRLLGIKMVYLCQKGNVAPRGHLCNYSRMDMENDPYCCEPSPFIRHVIHSSVRYEEPATLRELVATSLSVPIEFIAGIGTVIIAANSYAARRKQTQEERVSPVTQ